MVLIGYQGVKGSNSEEAARLLAIKHHFKDYRLIPLVSSFNVIENVLSKNVDYGVIAMRNNTGGTVKESMQSIYNMEVLKVDSITLPIHHFLFVKDKLVVKADILHIASHSQALIQCAHHLSENYPNVILISDEDTATAAIKLRIDLFDRNTAVICRENAGISNGLFLLESFLEDREDNSTDFDMYTFK